MRPYGRARTSPVFCARWKHRPAACAPNSLGAYFSFQQAASRLGAQVPPLGAVPNSFGDPTRVAELDLASANYRDQLNSVVASTISGLAATGITIRVYTFDVWLGVIRVLGQPRRYGFVDTIDSAQDRSGVVES